MRGAGRAESGGGFPVSHTWARGRLLSIHKAIDAPPTDAVALGRELEKIEREAAERREKAGRPKADGTSGKFPEDTKGDVRDKVGDAVGMSGVLIYFRFRDFTGGSSTSRSAGRHSRARAIAPNVLIVTLEVCKFYSAFWV